MRRRDDYLQHLARVPLFAACSRKDLSLLARRAEDVRVNEGTKLITEGSAGHEFFVIVSGAANVTRNGRKIASLGPGDYFGELALLDRAPRNATITATEPTELVVLAQREFSGVLDEVPGLARKLLTGMARRVREADAKSVH